MIYSKNQLWDVIAPVIKELGFKLFDIDMPSSKKGVVRVFICSTEVQVNDSGQQAGISIDDCVLVARRLNSLAAFEDLRERYSLEVSSPGVNRKLQSLEHFEGAIGERVKITFFDCDDEGTQKANTIIGKLADVVGDELSLLVEPSGDNCALKYDQVHKARVDFLFEEVRE